MIQKEKDSFIYSIMKNIITWKHFLNEDIDSKKIFLGGALVGNLLASDPVSSQNINNNPVEQSDIYIQQNEWVFNHDFGFGEVPVRLVSDQNIKYQKKEEKLILDEIKKELEKIALDVHFMASRAGSDRVVESYARWHGIKIYIEQGNIDRSIHDVPVYINKVEWWLPTKKEVWFEKYYPYEGIWRRFLETEDRWIKINVNRSGVWSWLRPPGIQGSYQKECPILKKEENKIEKNNLLSPKELRKEMRRIRVNQIIQKEKDL
jgi:hypothetical protein